MLSALSDLLFLLLRNVRVHFVGAVSVGVEPVRVISGLVGAPPELQRGFDPTYFLSHGLFSHTYAYGRSLPVGII